MDSISWPDFVKIFSRTSHSVDLKGATAAWLINERLEECRDYHFQQAYKFREQGRHGLAKYHIEISSNLDTLIEHDFPVRTIREANRDVRGLIAQSLIYGPDEAELRVRAYRKAHIVDYAARKRELRSIRYRRRITG